MWWRPVLSRGRGFNESVVVSYSLKEKYIEDSQEIVPQNTMEICQYSFLKIVICSFIFEVQNHPLNHHKNFSPKQEPE